MTIGGNMLGLQREALTWFRQIIVLKEYRSDVAFQVFFEREVRVTVFPPPNFKYCLFYFFSPR